MNVFGICETFINRTVDDSILNIEGYKFERKDREDCSLTECDNGDGILIYIGNHMNYVRRKDLETLYLESVWIEIRIKNNKPFLICSVYRPPSAKTEGFEKFFKQIEEAACDVSEIYVMGDFNIDICNGEITNTN